MEKFLTPRRNTLLFSPGGNLKTIRRACTCLWVWKLCCKSGRKHFQILTAAGGLGSRDIFPLSIFLNFLWAFFPIKSMYYFIVGKNQINKNKQISGCYDERIGWELHYLASPRPLPGSHYTHRLTTGSWHPARASWPTPHHTRCQI